MEKWIWILPILIILLNILGIWVTNQEAGTNSYWNAFRGFIIGICTIGLLNTCLPVKRIDKVTDVIYNPKDSSWHLDIVTGKDTVEVPINAITAAKFIHK